MKLQEFFWLFAIYEYFSKIAMHVDYQTITGHDIIRKNTHETQGRHTNHGSVKCIHWSYRQKKLNSFRASQGWYWSHPRWIFALCVCVRFCIGSLIKPPNHVCVSNTEILILKMNILVKRRTFLLFLNIVSFYMLWLKSRKSLNLILVWVFDYCAFKNKRSLIYFFSKYHYDHL